MGSGFSGAVWGATRDPYLGDFSAFAGHFDKEKLELV